MYEFTVEHRTFIVSKWFECRCAVQVRRAFRREFTEFHGKNLPSIKFIQRIVDKFNIYGSVTDRRRKYCPANIYLPEV